MKRLFLVGLGPGCREERTARAALALERSEVICGYTGYTALVRPGYPDKEYLETGMRGEVERCRAALTLAASGKTVSLVCSGDAGVYGMAGPVFALSEEFPEVEIEVIPGVTAAQSGAAMLGAPLMLDYAVISLSDLLVPWDQIEARLRAAAMGGFALVLYNPASRKRTGQLARACEIVLETRSADTVCGLVRSIGRPGASSRVLTLGELKNTPADMFTTIFIGSADTCLIGGKMVAPRGYPAKR